MSYHNRWIYILAGLPHTRCLCLFLISVSKCRCLTILPDNPAPGLTDVHAGCCRSARCKSVVLLLILMSVHTDSRFVAGTCQFTVPFTAFTFLHSYSWIHQSKDSIPSQNPILLPPQSYEELLGRCMFVGQNPETSY